MLGMLGRNVARGAKRDAFRPVRSARYHTKRVVTRPIRTLFAIVFTTLLVGVLYTVTMDQSAIAALDTVEGDVVGTALALLPPLPILLLIGVAMVVLVPVTSVTSGIRRDVRYRRNR